VSVSARTNVSSVTGSAAASPDIKEKYVIIIEKMRISNFS
jgi:hypothetical protein